MGREGSLAPSQLDMLGGKTVGDSLEPAAVGEPADGDLFGEGGPHELGADLHVAVHRDLGHVEHADGLHLLALAGHDRSAFGDADLHPLFGHVQGPGRGIPRSQTARLGNGATGVQVGLIGQAYADQRAPWTLGTVDKGRGSLGRGGHHSQSLD